MPVLSYDYLEKWGRGDTFIETGTYTGFTTMMARGWGFKKIHTVELMPHLYEKALDRFKDEDRITCWLGDTPDVLRENILPSLEGEATFWLDAHMMGPTNHVPNGVAGSNKYGPAPILHELKAISEHPVKTHTIFIDDQRLFDTQVWNNVKRSDALRIIKQINPRYEFEWLDGGVGDWQRHLANDIIVAYIK